MPANFAFHVDCDPLWVYEEEFEVKIGHYDLLYGQALASMLDLFKIYNVSATFFIVGRDLRNSSCREFCNRAIAEGHNLGNQTYNHAMTFRKMEFGQKRAEIKDAHDAIFQETGFLPVGFRGPGYDSDNCVFNVLNELSYLYDSSMLPGMATAIMAMHNIIKRLAKNKSFSTFDNFFATRKITERRPGLYEVPIAVLPLIRSPLHTTFIYKFGRNYLDFGLNILQRSAGHHVILLHAIDLLDHPRRCEFSNHILPMKWPLNKRIDLIKHLIDKTINQTIQTETFLAGSRKLLSHAVAA